MVTECDASQADFSPSLMKNEWTKAEDYHCISYVYEPGDSFKPLAQIRGRGRGGRAYYYINDQLGTPQELVAADGEIVWSGIYRTYGNLAIAAGGVEQSLRFQGQYYDEESGLHYNRYRYYDPLAGRYLSQDPIGLLGGINSYSYVKNPLTWIDPLGLKGCDLTGNNWKFNPEKDVDLRGTGKTYRDALDEAFRRTGVPREKFEVTKWGTDQYGKSIPVEWQGPGGANVNMDIPSWNNVKPNGALGEGPHAPHIGYQTPGKPRVRGHIFVDLVPATRR